MLYATLLSLMLSTAGSGEPVPQKPVAKEGLPANLNKTRLLRLVNDLRSKGGQCGDTWYPPAPPLTWNDQLEQAAQAHSNDMLARKYSNHFSPEGNNAGERIDKAGYHWKTFGENIGMGYKNEDEVVAAWKSSPGHCKNLLSAKYKEMGVARAGQYWTQNLGSK